MSFDVHRKYIFRYLGLGLISKIEVSYLRETTGQFERDLEEIENT